MAKKADRRAVVTVKGAGGPKRTRQARKVWAKKTEDKFFERLADSCNVTMAAEHAGVWPQRAYARRKIDAAFRQRWDEAVSTAFAQLELELLKRALHGVEKVVTTRGGESSIIREYSDRTALALLKMHRDTAVSADTEVAEEDYQEACERILERLERIRERDDAAAAGIETKAARPIGERIGAHLRWRLERGCA